jgi:hypothetical protein
VRNESWRIVEGVANRPRRTPYFADYTDNIRIHAGAAAAMPADSSCRRKSWSSALCLGDDHGQHSSAGLQERAGDAAGGFLNRRDHCLAAKVSASQA